MNRTIHLLILALLAALPVTLRAQDEPEYRADIGGGLGLMAYQGDYSESLTKNMHVFGGAMARYKPNPRSAWYLGVMFGAIEGYKVNAPTYYPLIEGVHRFFNHSLADITLKYEYNFWPYGTGREYRGAKPLVPYMTLGLGYTICSTDAGSVGAMAFPIGVGVKYKVAKRLNLALEWTMHFSGSDKLDLAEDPYGIKSQGLFRNTDSYSMLMVALSYDLWQKCRVCHKE